MILILLSERYPRLIALFDVSLGDVAKAKECSEPEASETDMGRRVLAMSAWIVGLFILIFLIGFLITVPLFAFLFLKIHGHVGWLKTLAVSIVIGSVIYSGFEIAMKVDMFNGILFGDLPPPI